MSDLVRFMQDAVAVAFVALGVLVAINWLRRRDRSMGFLALAIILLAAVSGLGRLQAHLPFTIPLLGTLNLLGFAGSGYALLLYRDSRSPPPRRWHAVAIASLAAASVFLIVAQALSVGRTTSTIIAVVWVLIWCACVGEPIARFWLVARNLPAVQAWRLRSLSIGFGGLVGILLFAISIGFLVREPIIQVIFELAALAIVPLLYASLAPPTWLRRQWRAPEEEGLRAFMEDLLVNEDRDALAKRALEWATRLVGAAAAVQFDASGKATASRGVDSAQVVELGRMLPRLHRGVSRISLSDGDTSVVVLRVARLSSAGTLGLVAAPWTPTSGKKNIALRVSVDGAGDVLADGGKLKQMLLNLVSNAIKFTPEEGTVTIAAVRVKDTVEISVADTGIGIADADMKEIFHEFHQVDPGPGRKHEGTGLGLALTRRFAALHGGDVRVSSQVNKGSVFTLVMPIHATVRPPSEPAVARSMNGHGAGPLVLVVEDDPAAAELLTRQLGNAGYRTEVAKSGTQALALARELKPAAITLDIIMPELDGWEVITRLKSDAATSHIPVVVVSVVDNPELGIALGAIDYFVKPVNASALVERLDRFDAPHAPGNRKVRVLVVDDEPANRTLLTEALEPAGFTVMTASGGRDAIKIAKRSKPDLVLLDLLMPDVNGFDVVEALRADDKTRDTPIMVLTAANLTEADKRQLNGRVSQILSRGSVATSDIVGLLKNVVAQRNGGK